MALDNRVIACISCPIRILGSFQMKRNLFAAMGLAAVLVLSACGKKEDAAAVEAAPAPVAEEVAPVADQQAADAAVAAQACTQDCGTIQCAAGETAVCDCAAEPKAKCEPAAAPVAEEGAPAVEAAPEAAPVQ
jgi:hypothetical protein